MKIKFLIIVCALSAYAFARQDSFTFNRQYKAAEETNYTMSLGLASSMGSVDIKLTTHEVVKKVYDNGDADLETSLTDMHVLFNGNEMPAGNQANQKSTRRVSKFGVPVGKSQTAGRTQMGMEFLRFANLSPDKPMKVGDTFAVNEVSKEDPKSKVIGTIKLDSIANGVAKFVSTMQVYSAQSDKPIKLNLSSYVDTATSKANKVEGTASDLPSQGQMQVDSVQFVIERKK